MAKRVSYAKVEFPIEVPNLIDIQLSSYRDFLQEEIAKTRRETPGKFCGTGRKRKEDN